MSSIVSRRTLFVKYWAPLLSYAALIFLLSSLSHPEDHLPGGFQFLNDKVVHAIEYGVLGVLFFRAFRFASGPHMVQFALPLAIISATLYGLTDEMHQYFVPHRESDPWDILANFCGASIAVLGWHAMNWQGKLSE